MKRLTLTIALALAASARAEPERVGLHMLSAHQHAGYEAFTVGAYGVWSGGLTAGALRNSERRLSLYLGQTWETSDRQWSLTVGGITGYRETCLSPLLVPSFRTRLTQDLALRLSAIPKPPRTGGSAAAHVSIEIDLK